MSPKRTIALSVPNLGEEEWLALKAPLESGWLTQGPHVEAFEVAFAARHAVKHAVAVTSGTTALHVALTAADIGPGDEVIVPAFTWVATANAVVYAGATPVFADVLPDTYNADPADVERHLTERTKAVIAVHLFGLCADLDGLRTVLPEQVMIIEDAACAVGAAYRGRPAGSMGKVGCFSFHPRKSITTGEGGMVTTDDDAIAATARSLRNHGAEATDDTEFPHTMPEFPRLDFNYRMTELQAAIGQVQLTKLDGFIDERASWAHLYYEELGSLGWLELPHVDERDRHAWQAFVTVVDEDASTMTRNELMQILQLAGIATRPGTHVVTELAYYRNLGVDSKSYPVARTLHHRSMAIPMHNRMSADDCRYVIETLRSL